MSGLPLRLPGPPSLPCRCLACLTLPCHAHPSTHLVAVHLSMHISYFSNSRKTRRQVEAARSAPQRRSESPSGHYTAWCSGPATHLHALLRWVRAKVDWRRRPIPWLSSVPLAHSLLNERRGSGCRCGDAGLDGWMNGKDNVNCMY